MEELLYLLEKEGIDYKKEDPSKNTDPYYGTIETPHGFMTWRKLE